MSNYSIHDFIVGARVELHPATDLWMRGDRYGTVTKLGRLFVHVRLDKSERTVLINTHNIANILEA